MTLLTPTLFTALRLFAFAGSLAVALATLLGLLAPWLPYLDLFNHFRPMLLAGAVALLALALILKGRSLVWVAATVAAVQPGSLCLRNYWLRCECRQRQPKIPARCVAQCVVPEPTHRPHREFPA